MAVKEDKHQRTIIVEDRKDKQELKTRRDLRHFIFRDAPSMTHFFHIDRKKVFKKQYFIDISQLERGFYDCMALPMFRKTFGFYSAEVDMALILFRSVFYVGVLPIVFLEVIRT